MHVMCIVLHIEISRAYSPFFLRLQHAPHVLTPEELHWEPGPICCFPAGPSNSLQLLGLGFRIRSMGLTLSTWNPTEN